MQEGRGQRLNFAERENYQFRFDCHLSQVYTINFSHTKRKEKQVNFVHLVVSSFVKTTYTIKWNTKPIQRQRVFRFRACFHFFLAFQLLAACTHQRRDIRWREPLANRKDKGCPEVLLTAFTHLQKSAGAFALFFIKIDSYRYIRRKTINSYAFMPCLGLGSLIIVMKYIWYWRVYVTRDRLIQRFWSFYKIEIKLQRFRRQNRIMLRYTFAISH